MVTTPDTLSPLVAIVLIGYLVYSIWNAYSTGCNNGMLKKNQIKGIIRYGPYLSLTISFIGITIAVFIIYELLGYYTGFLRLNLPADLANLDFFTFLLRQFSSIKLAYKSYIAFLVIGVTVSSMASLFLVRFLYKEGVNKITESR